MFLLNCKYRKTRYSESKNGIIIFGGASIKFSSYIYMCIYDRSLLSCIWIFNYLCQCNFWAAELLVIVAEVYYRKNDANRITYSKITFQQT